MSKLVNNFGCIVNFENAILKMIFFKSDMRRFHLKFGFVDSFSSVSFNGSENLKLQNFEILTRQLCQLASDTAIVFDLPNCLYDYIRTIHKLLK